METFVDISKLFIPLIAFIGIYIAWNQFKANSDKLRFELYEKRFSIYDGITQYLGSILWDTENIEPFERHNFERFCNEAEFILPNSVCIKVDEVRSLVRQWRNVNRRLEYLNRKGDCESRAKQAIEEMEEIESQLEDLQPELKEAFKVVLKFEKF